VLAPAANKEIEALQRDIALLQQQIKDLQKSQDEKLAALLEPRVGLWMQPTRPTPVWP
jgi:flagellar motility protein MotE (MotC chaperone)